MNPVDREGTFKAEITDYSIREQESGAVAVVLQVKLTEMWDAYNQGWVDWPYDMEAYGDVWVVKKDGTLNNSAIQSLVKHAGWDGNFDSIATRTWHPTPCQVVIAADTYKDQTRYRVSFINDLNRTPGQLATVDPAKAKELQTRFGSQLRAIAGTARHNEVKPANGRPPAPPPAKKPHINEELAAVKSGATTYDDSEIPF